MTRNLRMPAEWEPHDATWLAWPHYKDDWPGKFEPIPWVYAEIIRHLARHERVELIVNDAASEKRARKTLKLANALSDNIRFHRWPTDRVWTRDSGCTFVKCDPALPATANREGEDLRTAAAERRKNKPHGASRGLRSEHDQAPEERKNSSDTNLAAIKWRFN